MTSEESEVTESVAETSNPRRTRRRRLRRPKSRERPATATLAHPSVLDETLKDKVDMTLTKKELLAAVKLCNLPSSFSNPPTRTASNLAKLRKLRQYSSNDETGSSSGSVEHIYSPPKGRRSRLRTSGGGRPATSRLEKPSNSDLDVPNIRYYSKPRNMKARLNNKLKADARKKILTREDSICEPCFSCGRSDQPERFHTHPGRFPPKSPLKEAKSNNTNNNSNNTPSKEKEKEGKPKKETPRSLSPRKSLSPDKSVSASSSPLARRKLDRSGKENEDKKGERSGKENEEAKKKTTTEEEKKKELDKRRRLREKKGRDSSSSPFKGSPTKGRLGRSPDVKEGKHGKDFPVDIFTSKPGETTSQSKEKDEATEEDKDSKSEKTGAPQTPIHPGRPTAVKCKICGKEFGKASIKFHEPQCVRKRQGEEDRKERERLAEIQQEKTASYMDHLALLISSSKSSVWPPEFKEEEGLNDSFDAIWQQHMQQLQPCTSCGRTFFPERLIIHERSCKSKTPRTADPQAASGRRQRMGQISPLPEKPARDIPVQYFIGK